MIVQINTNDRDHMHHIETALGSVISRRLSVEEQDGTERLVENMKKTERFLETILPTKTKVELTDKQIDNLITGLHRLMREQFEKMKVYADQGLEIGEQVHLVDVMEECPQTLREFVETIDEYHYEEDEDGDINFKYINAYDYLIEFDTEGLERDKRLFSDIAAYQEIKNLLIWKRDEV